MFRYGLLVLSPSCIRTKIPALLKQVSEEVKEVLYVDIYEPDFVCHHVRSLYELLVDVYGCSSSRTGQLDVRVLLPWTLTADKNKSEEVRHLCKKPEVAFVRDVFGQDPSKDVGLFELKQWMTRRFQLSDLDRKLRYLKVEEGKINDEITSKKRSLDLNGACLQTYEEVVLGGTFDHMHSGHRLLLAAASLICDKRITVGLSEGPLLQRKILKELIEPFQDRKTKLEEFIGDIKPGINISLIMIMCSLLNISYYI